MRMFILLVLIAPSLLSRLCAQGMSAEARENIHTLLSNHGTITRTVTLTDDGYVAITESNDTAIVRVLHEHIAQMESRLERGRMVRRWDPAFVEYAQHYENMEHTLVAADKGLFLTVRGTTPEAIAAAQNHAEIVTDFVTNGLEGHNRTHPAVLETSETAETGACCQGNGCGGKMHGQGGKARRGSVHEGRED